MPLIEPVRPHSLRMLIFIGAPSLLLALLLSLWVSNAVSNGVHHSACPGTPQPAGTSTGTSRELTGDQDCPEASLAYVGCRISIAIVGFALYIRFPRILFFGLLALLNAVARIPETIGLMVQMALKISSRIPSEEAFALRLLHFKDPTASMVLLLFYLLGLIFFAVIVVHDLRPLRWKWTFAAFLLVSTVPLERMLWGSIGRFFS